MIQKHWWDRYPERLEYELRMLREAGLQPERDEKAFEAGVLRLRLVSDLDGAQQRLEATFPDLYPYFRVELAAPAIHLPHHQHPQSKYLCLMGRPTFYWQTTDTAAGLVLSQIPRVFETARATERTAVIGKEQQQAEPYGDYYPYVPSMLLVQGNWVIPEAEQSGSLVIGLPKEAEQLDEPFIRGAVLEIRSNNGRSLARADQALHAVCSGRTAYARWVRVREPISLFNPKDFFDHVRRLDPGRNHNRDIEWSGRALQVYAVLFPEEVGHRRQGEGWVFACQFIRDRRVLQRNKLLSQKIETKREEGHYFARAGRASPEDLQLRTPELQPLIAKTAALFGLGCVGAPVALELARAGLGHLKVVDDDVVDPGTIGRWPIGLSAAGRKKVEVIQSFVALNYPGTKVTPIDHRIGGTRPGQPGEKPDEIVLSRIVAGISVICDTTAEIGVQHFLSDLARDLKLPYISIVGTCGGWGGKIIRILPGLTQGCWLCSQHAFQSGTIPEPPSDEERVVQPLGCGSPTFTGAGFDLAQVALSGVRTVVSTICSGQVQGYPECDWDIMTMAFRSQRGELIPPSFRTYKVLKHPACPRCNPNEAD